MNNKQKLVYQYLITDTSSLSDVFNSIKDYVIISNYNLLTTKVPPFSTLSEADIKVILEKILTTY